MDLWERQKRETNKAFEAFTLYRDMGIGRSTAKVAQQLGKSKALIDRWSSRWNWVERVRVYEDYQDELKRRVQEKEVEKMAKRHANIAMAMLKMAAEALQDMINRQKKIKSHLIPTYVERATNLERLSRGAATEILQGKIDHTGKIEHEHYDYSGYTKEELEEELRRLAAEAEDYANKGQA